MMQILVGLNELGRLQHVELLSAIGPLQMIGLARAREAFFARVEVWEGAVCIFRSASRQSLRTEPLSVRPRLA